MWRNRQRNLVLCQICPKRNFLLCAELSFLLPGGYFHIRRSGGLAPKFSSEILVGAPNFASKNIGDKYHKFCPLNFRFDPKIGIFPQLLRYVITELPKFFLLFGELGRTLPQISPPNLIRGPGLPPPPPRPPNMEVTPPPGFLLFKGLDEYFNECERSNLERRSKKYKRKVTKTDS